MSLPDHGIVQRLFNQKLLRVAPSAPHDIVAWMGAVQAQDYAGARWALGLRSKRATDALVEAAYDDGRLLRTHVLRPTWHFVAPADIRWLLALTAPRVNAANAFYYRRLELDARTFAKSRRVIERVLRGGSFLTRTELATALARAGLPAEGVRLAYLVMEAELAALVCSGPRRGKQMTYALLEERVPAARALTRDEALATLTQRYFTSHGPATLRDYVWWSGLTAQEARAGLEMTRTSWAEETRDGRTTWCAPSQAATRLPSPLVHLLPTYDEFLIAYKDREGLRDPRQPARRLAFDEYAHHLVIDGRLRGTWKRTLGARRVELSVRPLRTLSRDEQRALALAAARYGQFVGKPVTVTVG